MQRPLAMLTGLAVALGGLTLGALPAANAVVAPTTTASTAISDPMKGVRHGQASAVKLLDHLAVRSEGHSTSYARSRFKVWIDANHDGENTRAEVLKRQSRITASVNRYGTVKGGRWISVYDNTVVTKASRLDVDHMVPLAEAWASGAWKWSAKRREAFGNDLGYKPSLIAVTLSSNRSKGDSDPAEWMPEATSFACAYVKDWIGVKSRWGLSVDRTEKAALLGTLASCATYGVDKPAAPVIAKLVGTTTKKTTHHRPPSSGSSSGGGSVYYKNCDAVRAAGAAPLHRGDPGYETPRLDRDGDGVACE